MKCSLSKKTFYGSFREGIAKNKCKTKPIRTDLGTSRHNQTHPGIIQVYIDIFNRVLP